LQPECKLKQILAARRASWIYPGRMTALRAVRLLACAVAVAGIALRLDGFGRHAFWNDEAWVAIATRVEGVRQFLLALSVTPIGWGVALRLLAFAPGPPEVTLRLLPLGFGIASQWLAWRLGTRLAGHALGGLLALSLVAFDPTGIVWSQQLKPYTAEAALALAAFLAAATVARRGLPRDVAALALVLALGVMLSNAQLLLAPPLMLTLAAGAVLRRDGALLRRLVVAGVLVALWDLTWFTLVIHPWLTPALHEFWQGHYAPSGSIAALGAFAGSAADRLLAPALGPYGVALALGGLVVLFATRDGRWAAVALLLLLAQLVVLSAAERFPLDVPRTALFVTTMLLVSTGAAAARAVVWGWQRAALRPLAATAAIVLVGLVARGHWMPASVQVRPEDLGPLVHIMERDRRAGDRILLYARSLFVWGYYRTATPVLVPNPALANGFVVAVDDPDVVVVAPGDIAGPVARATSGASRLWLVGSRFATGDDQRLRAALAHAGRIVQEEHGERALLLLIERP
jgi:hypothetical protein